MDWKARIKEGMKLMQEGCAQNKEWTKCFDCPFDFVCEQIQMAQREGITLDIPQTWLIE